MTDSGPDLALRGPGLPGPARRRLGRRRRSHLRPRPAGSTGDPDLDARVESLLDALGVTANRDQLRELLVTVVAPGPGPCRPAGPEDRQRRPEGDVGGLRGLRPLPGRAQGHHVRLGPDAARPTRSTPRPATWPPVLAAHGLVDGDRRRPGDHGRRPRRGRPGPRLRDQHPAAVRAGAPTSSSSDPKLVSMKYFFTRKLLLMKESDGYAVLPGGFGTLDEAFELLTLLQTGKAEPAPVVLLEVPGGSYWQGMGALRHRRGGGPRPDRARGHQPLPDHRRRHRGRRGDPRLLPQLPLAALGGRPPGDPPAGARPPAGEVSALCEEFAGMCLRGGIEVLPGPCPAEVREGDHLDLPRIATAFRQALARPSSPFDRRPQCAPERSPAAGRPPRTAQPACSRLIP